MSRPFVIRANKLAKSFDGHKVLREVSVELLQGEVVVLRGANGSGKTTLLNILSGFVTPDAGRLEIRFKEDVLGVDFGKAPLSSILARGFGPEQVAQFGCGRTWQDIRLFQTQTVEANVAVAGRTADTSGLAWLLNWRRGGRAERRNIAEVRALLERVGLTEFAGRRADALSLGLSKKVAIVRAVRGGATVLFLDEPISGLDQEGVASVLELLGELAENPELTLVVVEHVLNLPHLLDLATTVWTLEDGQVYTGKPESLQEAVTSPWGQGLDFPAFLTDLPEVSRTTYSGGGVLSVRRARASVQGSGIVTVKGLVVQRGGQFVLGRRDGGLEFSLRSGEIGLLVAPNGWGKTTLLDAIAGLTEVTSGSIRLSGREMRGVPSWVRAQDGLSYLRARDFVFPRLNVDEQLQLAQVDGDRRIAGSLGVRRLANLSGGERQRLGLRSVLARKSGSLILLDEPFSALDEAGLELLRSSLIQAAEHTAILVAVPGVLGP